MAAAPIVHVTYVDLRTSHWLMWSRPRELAEIIGGVATSVLPRGKTVGRSAVL